MDDESRAPKKGDFDGIEGSAEEISALIDQELTEAAGPGEKVLKMVRQLEDLNAAENFPQNDLGTARLLAEITKNECRYSPTVKDWMHYDGTRWIRDPEGMAIRKKCKVLADAVLQYALYGPIEEKKREDYLKYAFKLTSSRARNTAVNDAKDINCFSAEEMDADDNLLNCLNCTLDLSKDPPVAREHNPDDLLSKVANVEYDPDAACPLWTATICQIMQDDKEKIHYLQKRDGYCLTGDTSQEEMYFDYGSTSRNGKSTHAETILYILGDYGETITPETLAIKNNKDSRTASPDLAKLAGARMVVASEPPKRMLFDASLAKTLTGRDRITARFLHENEFEFLPKFKLIFNCNSLPSINDQTVFLSERIRVLEFNRHFTEAEQDKDLKRKLRSEASGILNWMIEGLRTYHEEGLIPPDPVRKATDDYAEDSDKLGKFIEENLIERPGKNCKGGDAYQLYEIWTHDNGYGTESKSNFFADLKAKGIFQKHGKVDGVPWTNVIHGYVINDSCFRSLMPGEKTPFDS